MGFFDKIKAGLTKTRDALGNTLGNVFTASEIDDDFYDELEESLIMADLGVEIAYNLDGGGSSTMVFNGKLINNPTTNGKSIKERSVSDIVYIGY